MWILKVISYTSSFVFYTETFYVSILKPKFDLTFEHYKCTAQIFLKVFVYNKILYKQCNENIFISHLISRTIRFSLELNLHRLKITASIMGMLSLPLYQGTYSSGERPFEDIPTILITELLLPGCSTTDRHTATHLELRSKWEMSD